MLRALKAGGVIPYTPEGDDDEEPKTVFFLRVPTERAMRAIENSIEPWVNPSTTAVKQETASAVYFSLWYCLRGWDNFADHEGAVLEFSKALGKPNDYKGPEGDEAIRGIEKAIDHIPHQLREELYIKIRELGTVAPKN